VSGIAEDEVTWVDLPTEAPYHVTSSRSLEGSLWTAREAARLQTPEVLALARGEVDAIYTYAPTGLGLLELLDANIVVSLPPRGPEAAGMGTLSVLTVSQRLLDERPDVVERYLRTLWQAADWASDHHEEAWRVFAAEEGVPEEWAAASFGGTSPLELRPDLRPHLVHALQREADFLWARQLIPAPVDVEDWSDPSPLWAAQETRQKELA
jgi:ABC-type nitrate/sulfonate/bicarbonate transport system substrate-binding protein